MKVLHITTIDTGGAYKAAYRLHESMQLCGLDSTILVRTKLNPMSKVQEAFADHVGAFVSKGKNVINMLLAKGGIAYDKFGTDLSKHLLVKEASVLVLHWINSFLSYRDIEKLGQLGKPIIWVMHDMWLFTGGCHVDGYCGKYEEGCGNCPLIPGKRESDLSHRNFLKKIELMKKLDVTVIGPSEWIVEQACKSDILHRKRIIHISNALDMNLFSNVSDREELRRKYGFRQDQRVILFGAADSGTENENKGFRFLRDAFRYLDISQYILLIFGNTGQDLGLPDGLEVIKAGFIAEEKKMVELYNVADVLVNPSSQESFGYTVCEAMACGTPAVGFPIGGIKEQIVHKESGYLAKYHDSEDLAVGIRFCVEHREELGQNARQSVWKFSYERIGSTYKEILNDIC